MTYSPSLPTWSRRAQRLLFGVSMLSLVIASPVAVLALALLLADQSGVLVRSLWLPVCITPLCLSQFLLPGNQRRMMQELRTDEQRSVWQQFEDAQVTDQRAARVLELLAVRARERVAIVVGTCVAITGLTAQLGLSLSRQPALGVAPTAAVAAEVALTVVAACLGAWVCVVLVRFQRRRTRHAERVLERLAAA